MDSRSSSPKILFWGLLFFFFTFNRQLTIVFADHSVEWQKFELLTLNIVHDLVKNYEHKLINITDESNVGEQCRESIIKYKDGLMKLENDAVKSK